MLKGHLVTSWPISGFWVSLSVLLAGLSTYSFLQADWVVKRNLIVTNYYEADRLYVLRSLHPTQSAFYEDPDDLELSTQNSTFPPAARKIVKVSRIITTTRFGTLGVCTSQLSNGIFHCRLYEQEGAAHPVSVLWPTVTMVGGSGCVALCVSAVLSLLAVSLPSSELRHQVATTIGHAQTVAVVLLFSSLLLFPLGFSSDFVRHHCGPAAGPYDIGDCEVGWAYALVLVCAALALYCPLLVKFTADVRYDSLPKYL